MKTTLSQYNVITWLFLTCDRCYAKEPEFQKIGARLIVFNLTGKDKIKENSTNQEINDYIMNFVVEKFKDYCPALLFY